MYHPQHKYADYSDYTNGSEQLPVFVAVHNLPPYTGWRRLRGLAAQFVGDDAIAYVQMLGDQDALVSVRGSDAGSILLGGLNNLHWDGYALVAQSGPLQAPGPAPLSEYYFPLAQFPYAPPGPPGAAVVPPPGSVSDVPSSGSNAAIFRASAPLETQHQHQQIPLLPPQTGHQTGPLSPIAASSSPIPFSQQLPPELGSPSLLTTPILPMPFVYHQTPHRYSLPPSQLGYVPFKQPQYGQYHPRSHSSTSSNSTNVSRNQTFKQLNYRSITDIIQDENSEPPDKKRLFIGNLPFSSQWNEVKDLLRLAGSINRVEIPKFSDGNSKGFAIALFDNELDAEKAISMFDGIVFQGRNLTVRYDKFSRASDGSKQAMSPPVEGIANLETPVDTEENHEALKDTTKEMETSEKEESKSDNEDDERFKNEARSLVESISALNVS